MREIILEGQRDVIAQIEAAGWAVTEAELSVYESPWLDEEVPEATVTITARKPFPDSEDNEDSPFRVK